MQLKDYIQGNRHGKEANRLEREAMNDPFLREALEGLDRVAGNHAKIIQKLEKKYTAHRTVVPQRRTLAPLPHKRILVFWSVAASVLFFLIGVSAYFLIEKNRQNTPTFAENRVAESEGLRYDSIMPQPKPTETPRLQKSKAVEADKKVIPAPTNPPATPVQAESINRQDDESATNKSSVDLSEAACTATEISEERKSKEEEKQAVYSPQNPFGEKEFQIYCRQKADTKVCAGKGATVKISFFIDETGKPTAIEYKKYSCEDAKKEMEKLLASSPVWTKTNRKVTLTIKW